jgi:hypothetical protein
MYKFFELTWIVRKGGEVMFWPVMARPGRQRKTRVAFDNPISAIRYGQRLQARFVYIFSVCTQEVHDQQDEQGFLFCHWCGKQLDAHTRYRKFMGLDFGNKSDVCCIELITPEEKANANQL